MHLWLGSLGSVKCVTPVIDNKSRRRGGEDRNSDEPSSGRTNDDLTAAGE